MDNPFTFKEHMASLPVAFTIVLTSPKGKPNFFKRYPALWHGPNPKGQPIFITCSENGMPLLGRLATKDEKAELRDNPYLIKDVYTDVLGRNGRHLVRKNRSKWQLGRNGERWLSILMY